MAKSKWSYIYIFSFASCFLDVYKLLFISIKNAQKVLYEKAI